MPDATKKFEGLSDDYDRFRPRYPAELMQSIAKRLPAGDGLLVIDAGAGTGVALEGLVPLLGPGCRYQAVDLSHDMVSKGRAKFPDVEWFVEHVEPFLERASGVDLIVAAQSLQWLDRPRFLRAARACLGPGGVLAVIQNNRDFSASPFLNAYETLLEEYSPGYSRHYRDFDFAAEIREVFGDIEVEAIDWTRAMTQDDFVGMARSSTQVQRAVAAHGQAFYDRLAALVHDFAGDGPVEYPYHSELFTARMP